MNNILTEIGTLLTDRIDEQYEISELADCPILSISTFNGSIGTQLDTLSEDETQNIVDKYSSCLLCSFEEKNMRCHPHNVQTSWNCLTAIQKELS